MVEVRLLQRSDDTSQFRCGDIDLDRFLQLYAGQNQFRHHIGSTYVAVDGKRILGYVTIAPGQLEVEDLPVKARKRLPAYPIPILRLARLATDQSFQGKGLGGELLRFTLELARRIATEYGCFGVVVDALPAAVEFYERFGFLKLDVLEGQPQSRPQPVTMFLSMREIEAAAKADG